jgi:hypothetical protein
MKGFPINRSNDKMAVTNKGNNGWIRVTPLDKQTDPPLLSMIKQEVKNRWSNIFRNKYWIKSNVCGQS